MAFLSKYGEARHIYIAVPKAGSANHAVGADWTPAAGDVKISKDGGAAANVTNLPTAIAMGNSALWDFSLTATEMQAAQVMVLVADSATKAVDDTGFVIETYGNTSGQHAFDLDTASTAQTGDSYARLGAPAGASVSADIAGVQSDTNDIQTRLPAALTAGGNMKADALAISGDTTAADNAESFFDGTGYAGTNNVIPTVTTTTNLTTNNDKTGYRLSATGVDDVLDEVVEGSTTFRQMLRGFASALLAKLSGAATTTVAIRDIGDTKDRVTATVDSDGNRSAVTLDLS